MIDRDIQINNLIPIKIMDIQIKKIMDSINDLSLKKLIIDCIMI